MKNEDPRETTPLLPVAQAQEHLCRDDSRGGQATFWATVVTLMKTCMGTGTLALPFAVQKGGLLLNTLGLFGIAVWNAYSVNVLCHTLEVWKSNGTLAAEAIPSFATSKFAQVAWFAFGNKGVHGLDLMLLVLFFGIIVAYDDAILGFLHDTPLNSGVALIDALVIAAVVGTLSLVPDMGYLAKVSAWGLAVLLSTFLIIACYATSPEVVVSTQPLSLWPENGLAGVSDWFGCVVFGFGVVPLTYNYYESMAQPQLLPRATAVALGGTACLYVVLGCCLLHLYYPVDGDILEKLPTVGVIPLVVRLAMIIVAVFTAPLLVLPCGLIVEGKILSSTSKAKQAIVRYSICIVCAVISVGVPGFVYVLSFVGCFCVALVGFVVPPLVHISLLLQNGTLRSKPTLALDVSMLIWGIAATVISSTYTFSKLYNDPT